jgi:hypothetical protein
MKTVFHVSDGDEEIQDAAIRYTRGIFRDDSVDVAAVAVVANAAGIELVRSDSTYAEDIAELSAGDIEFIACEKSMAAAGLTGDDLSTGVTTAPTSVGALTRLQEDGYHYIKVP